MKEKTFSTNDASILLPETKALMAVINFSSSTREAGTVLL